MKSFKSKKWFGIPTIAVISAILVICALCATTGVLVADWAFSSQLGASVTITGSSLVAFKDLACTTQYNYPTDTLPSFGNINNDHAGNVSSNVVFYLKNTGTTYLDPTIATNLNVTGLSLHNTTVITSTPVELISPAFVPSSNSMPDQPATGNGLRDAGATSLQTQAGMPGGVPSSGAFIEVASGEIYTYTNIVGHVISGIVGGQLGTVDAGHPDGTITFGTITAGGFAAGQVQTVTLKIMTDSTATPSTTPKTFNIIIASAAGS